MLDIVSHTWLPLAIVILGIIRHEDCGAAFEQKTSLICMPGGKSPRHAQIVKENTLKNPTCPITPPSRHHLYIIHLTYILHCFYHITLWIKWPLVPKSDIKRQFTTTYYIPSVLIVSDMWIITLLAWGSLILSLLLMRFNSCPDWRPQTWFLLCNLNAEKLWPSLNSPIIRALIEGSFFH